LRRILGRHPLLPGGVILSQWIGICDQVAIEFIPPTTSTSSKLTAATTFQLPSSFRAVRMVLCLYDPREHSGGPQIHEGVPAATRQT
jgi:hypothetical protein